MGRVDSAIDFLFRTLKGRLVLLACTAFIASMCSGCFLFSCPACLFQTIGCDTCASCFIECDTEMCDAKYDSKGNNQDGCCSDSDDDGCCSDSPEPTVTYTIRVWAYDSDGNFIDELNVRSERYKESKIEDIKTIPSWSGADYNTYFRYDAAYTKAENRELSGKISDGNGTITVKNALKNNRTIYIKVVEKASVGETYTINFYQERDSVNTLLDPIDATVGYPLTNFPTSEDVPTLEDGRVLIGWETDNGIRITINRNSKFHPYQFSATDLVINLYPIYGTKTYNVIVYVEDARNDFGGLSYNYALQDVLSGVNTNIGENKVLKGWAFNMDNYNAKIVDLTQAEANDYRVTEDMTLYAVYVEGFYITLHNVEGPHSDVTDQVAVAEGDYYTFTDPTATQGPYAFAGWYTSPDFDSYTRVSNDTIEITVTMERDYYADWTEETNNVITYFVRMGNAASYSEYQRDEYDYKRDETTPLVTIVGDNIPTGYKFDGWRKDGAEGDDTPWRALPAGTYGTIQLYAVYSPLTYDVLLYPEGGSIASMIATGDHYNSSIKFEEKKQFPVPTMEGRSFVGWYRRGTDTKVTDETGLMLESYKNAGGLILEARWQQKEYTVRFVLAGGGNYTSPQTVYHGNTVPACPTNEPTADDGFEFYRWEDESGNAYSPSTTVTSNITYTAKFRPKTYTITLKLPEGASFGNDGSTERQVDVTYQQTEIDLGIPNCPDGWIFEGWKIEGTNTILTIKDNGKCLLPAYLYTNNIVLVAVFTT